MEAYDSCPLCSYTTLKTQRPWISYTDSMSPWKVYEKVLLILKCILLELRDKIYIKPGSPKHQPLSDLQ